MAPSWSLGMYLAAKMRSSHTCSGVSTVGLRGLMTPMKATYFIDIKSVGANFLMDKRVNLLNTLCVFADGFANFLVDFLFVLFGSELDQEV